MTATRIIDDHLELANIGTNSHAQIDTHIAAADDYVKRDGSLALTSDWDIGDTRKILADEIRARDGAGLKLYDDGGNGIFVKDGGFVGIGTNDPKRQLHVKHTSLPYVHLTNDQSSHTEYDGMSIGLRTAPNEGYIRLRENWGLSLWANNVQRLFIQNDGDIGIGTTAPSAKLDINSDILRLQKTKTPATSGASGNPGDMCWDASYFYVCTATNTWKRSAIAAW